MAAEGCLYETIFALDEYFILPSSTDGFNRFIDRLTFANFKV